MTGYPWCRRSSRCWRLPNIFDPRLLSRESLTRFHSRSAPGITVLDYLRRIIRFTKVEVCPCARVACPHPSDASRKKSCLLLVLHYVDQICARMPLFTLSSLTCHRFIIASITVCSKGLCDTFCTNGLYARVGGIPPSELNVLEREFLRMIDWRLTVSTFSLALFFFFHLHLFRVRAIHLLFLLFPPPLYPDLDVSVSFPFVFISSSIFLTPAVRFGDFVSAHARSSKNITSISSARTAVGGFTFPARLAWRRAPSPRRASPRVWDRGPRRPCKASRWIPVLGSLPACCPRRVTNPQRSSSTRRDRYRKRLLSSKTWRLQTCRAHLAEGRVAFLLYGLVSRTSCTLLEFGGDGPSFPPVSGYNRRSHHARDWGQTQCTCIENKHDNPGKWNK